MIIAVMERGKKMNDTVYRKDVIDTMEKIMADHLIDGYEDECLLINAMKSLPSVDPEPSQLAKDIARILENDQDMRVILKNAETEIVRCMDCKHLQKWRSEESAKKFGQIYECARNVLNCPKPEDFCSRAERREDG